jgi:sarcosine oxidase subunit beta
MLFERRSVASGASGACGGFLFLQSKKPGVHLQLAMGSMERYDGLSEELEADIEFHRNGGLILIEEEVEAPIMEAFAQRQSELGLDVRLIGRKEVLRMEPRLDGPHLGATFSPADGQVNPLKLTMALVAAARRNRAEIQVGMPVRCIDREGEGYAIRTEQETVSVARVVIAAGVWSSALVAPLGIRLPVRPRKGQMMVTEPMPRLIHHVVLSAGYITAKYRQAEDPSADLGVGLALEQTDSGNLLVGSTREFAGFDQATTPEGLYAMARCARRAMPLLENLHIIRSFAGLRPWTPDGLPFLGKLPDHEGIFLAVGHEGDGIMLAPITGKLITEAILDRKPSVDLAALRVDRIDPI